MGWSPAPWALFRGARVSLDKQVICGTCSLTQREKVTPSSEAWIHRAQPFTGRWKEDAPEASGSRT